VNKYYLPTLAFIFFFVLITLVVYFSYSQNTLLKPIQRSTTTYQYQTVSAPIQPIPTLKSIDLNWVALGKELFQSTLLSKDNTISCASCHKLEQGGVDNLQLSVGIEGNIGTRNSPTVLNAVFNFRQFWDGRSHDLAEQMSGPVHNPVEMGSSWAQIIKKLNDDKQFSAAFYKLSPKGITRANIIRAITTFEESLITPNAPIDLYLKGDTNALTTQQKRGYLKFVGFGCVSCHQGLNIGGNLYQKIGRIDAIPSHLALDLGRYEFTLDENDKNVFKVPSLRNVALTAPYFHDGSVPDLDKAIMIMAQGQLGMSLSDEDIQDIKSLLQAFTGKLASLPEAGF
jgi:cytochrome c peroxidase